MRIYYVLTDSCIDFDASGSPSVQLFADLESARKYFEQEVKDARCDAEDGWVTESPDIDEERGVFAIYDDGRYLENHIEVRLDYQEL